MAKGAVPTARSQRRAIFWTSAITALGWLLFGYGTGVVSGALLFLKDSFGYLSSFDKGLVTALLLVGAAVGAIFAGRLAESIVAIWLLDRTGRRPLLIFGTAGMAVGMVVVALTFAIGGETLHGGSAYVAIAGLLIYTGSFAIGLGPVFWLLIAEVYPQRVRGPAMSVATVANWLANFVVTISFLTLLNSISGVGVFFLFAFLTLLALGYFIWRVPETKNMRLSDIEEQMEGSQWHPRVAIREAR